MGWSWRIAVVVALGALLAAAPGAAQEERGFSFVGGVAYEPGGPGPSVMDEMIAAGYVDQVPSSCQAPGCDHIAHPYYLDEGLSVAALLGLRYRFQAPWSLELLFSNGQRGHAKGYSHRARHHLIVAYTSFLATTTVGFHVGPLRLEAGPVLNATGWTATHNSGRPTKGRTGAFGGTVGASASVRLPDVLLSLKTGVRRFPPVDLSPAVQLPFEPTYQSFFIGLTAIPARD